MSTDTSNFGDALKRRSARLQSLSPEELKREPVHLVYTTWSEPLRKALGFPSVSSQEKAPLEPAAS